MKMVIFGLGKIYKLYQQYINDKDIVCYLDNNPDKAGTKFKNKPVFSPDIINQLKYDAIILMSKDKNLMKQQLLKLGVQENKILDYHQIPKLGGGIT